MKRHFTFLLFLSICMSLFAQNEGLSYQAVIINPDAKQLPGVDAKNNILPDTEIAIRFTIINALNQDEFQEIQYTRTDRFGMVNLLIGSENTDDFSLINWDGTIKDLKVEFDFEGSGGNFVDISRQQLTFIPYAYHRNITAHGTLTVDETTDLNGVLQVHGMTQLNSSLDVGGQTTLNDILTTHKNIYTNDSLFVDSVATFRGSAIFEKPSSFDDLMVNGQAVIKPQMKNAEKDTVYSSYPLLIEGSSQGIAIMVDSSRNTSNNFISFWDKNNGGDEIMWGRIEGQKTEELEYDDEYKMEVTERTIDIGAKSVDAVISGFEVIQSIINWVAALSSSTVCLGPAPCVTTPSFSTITAASLEMFMEMGNALVIAAELTKEIVTYDDFKSLHHDNIGVSYQSGAGDYAEYLPKENKSDLFEAGELVGVWNGMISKRIFGADRVMVVSTNPIVLGNMPQKQDESSYEKIAFMGQVPVRVIGEVKAGDYILPHEIILGLAKAIHPDKMVARDYKKVVGVAWNTISQIGNDLSLVNIAVGINTNDLADIVAEQKEEFDALISEYEFLKQQFDQSHLALIDLVPGYDEYVAYRPNLINTSLENVKGVIEPKDTCYTCQGNKSEVAVNISKEGLLNGLQMAKDEYARKSETYIKSSSSPASLMRLKGTNLKSYQKDNQGLIILSIEDHPFWSKIDSDPAYKEEIVQYVKANMDDAIITLNAENDSIKYSVNFVGF